MRKQIKGFEDYYVDTDGRVFRNWHGNFKELKGRDNTYGYLRIGLWKNNKQKWMYIHRLVATAFLSNPENYPQVNHLNGIKTDNRLENLEWCSSSQNMQHAVGTGLKNHKGSKNPLAKISEKQAIEIFRRLDNGESTYKIAKDYPITRQAVYSMKVGKSWTHLRLKI